MANTLTSLIPSAYAALDTVSRELVGLIPSVTRDATTERAAVGQTVYSPVAPASTAGDITPGVTPPDDGNQTIGNVSLSISKARRVPIRWNGEEQRGLNNGGAGYENILKDQFAQAFRRSATSRKPISQRCTSTPRALTARRARLRSALPATTPMRRTC
jgi:hypothetical protein